MKYFHNVWYGLQVFLLLVVVIAVLSQVSPIQQPIPGRDQGVYLYIGQQILEGKIPYKDVWDHKGPVIYYINAFGLFITKSIWGIWILEVVSLFTAALLGYFALRLIFDPATAFSSSVLWLVSIMPILVSGNEVEEYSLPLQFASIYLYLRSEKETQSCWREFFIGITAALSFALRPNNIGIHLSIILILVLRAFFSTKERSRIYKRIAAIMFGGLIVLGTIAIYFAFNKSLAQLLDSVFLYNYYYSRTSTFDWRILIKGYNYLAFLIQLGLLGLIGVITTLFFQWKSDNDKARFALLMLLVFPIQLYLSILSGRRYLHYYVAWLPSLAFLSGFLIFGIKQILLKVFQHYRYNTFLHPLAAYMFIVAYGLMPVINRIPAIIYLNKNIVSELQYPSLNYTATKENAHIEYILNHTQATDYVLIWGNEAFYNFITGREAPSRFVYTYAFGTPGYVSQEMADELLYSIIEKKPMIIDATANDHTIFGILSEKWKRFPITQSIIEYIKQNYVISDSQVGPDKWDVWIYKGD